MVRFPTWAMSVKSDCEGPPNSFFNGYQWGVGAVPEVKGLKTRNFSPQSNSWTYECLELDIHSTTHLKSVYTLVKLPRTVTPYRDSVYRTRDHVTYQKLVTL
jgi:hypothetical protein